ncbi:MAG: hypothetical protein BWY90_00301 [Deltaproteobacteria bacterium ADurb.BinA014]|jgi:hypothetical protein|nr:MAG: hypothetical protein BWY90_00301 [Deltaproteobacteria bacterium ADurb.BinA014]
MRYVDIITRITYDTVGEQNIARGTTLLSKQERGVAAIINKQSALRHALSATYEAERKGLTGAILLREQLSKSLDKNEAKLRKINIEASRAEKAAGMVSGGGGLLGGIGLLGGGAKAIAAAVGTASAAIVNITSEFQGYEAQLKTALGTTAAAEIALQQISEAAAKTPESVQSLTEAYVRLANTGLQPTIDELLKITDVSISQNKSVMAFSEAIIDAQTFEFERLKEFGILASKAGDKITFSFKGQEKQVAASALAVRDYLIGLGDMDGIAGAAEEKSKTLGGALSNLADSASRLAVSIGEILSPALTSIIRQFTDIISVADDFIGSTRDIFSAMNEAGQFDFSIHGAGAIGDFFEGISNRIGLDLDSPDLGIMKKWYGLLSDFSGIDLDDITGGAIGLKNALSKIRELSKLEVEGDIFGVLSGRIAALEAFRSEVSAATETYSASQRAAIDVLINRQIADLQEAYFASVGIMQQRAEAERKDAAKRARIAVEQRSKEAAKAAEAEARHIADIRKSAAKDLLRDIGELEAEITDLQLGASPESIEKLTAQNKAEKERALANIEARRTELTEQKALNAELSQSLDTLEALTKRRFDIQLGLDIDKFRSDVDKAVSKLNKLLGGGIEEARKERLDIDVTTNEGNIFGSYMARLAAISAANQSAISDIDRDFEERKKEIEALQTDPETRGKLLEKAAVERNLRLSNADISASNDRIALYSDYISGILELDKQGTKSRELSHQVATNNEIIALSKQYEDGIISKKKFEDSLTEIERRASIERAELQLKELTARRNIISGLLSNGSSLSDTLRQSLGRELEQINADISEVQVNVSAPKTDDGGFLAKLLGVTDDEAAGIVSLAKSVTGQVIKTIEAANQAEIARTDLLIKEQERRISEAERIADEGNAEQLELERKRLDGLQKQREQYVQRQLELNAILSASSFASATASAIEGVVKAAAEGGILAAITIPLYIASVGLGIASLINMLSNAQSGVQGFYEGVVGIEPSGSPRRGRRDRRDTIPAFLAPGESVMTVRATEKYGDLLSDMNAGRALSIPISEYSGTTNKIDLVLAAMQRQILSNNAASNVRIDKLETAIMKLTHHLNGGDVLMDGKKVGSVLDSRTRKANRITKLSR